MSALRHVKAFLPVGRSGEGRRAQDADVRVRAVGALGVGQRRRQLVDVLPHGQVGLRGVRDRERDAVLVGGLPCERVGRLRLDENRVVAAHH